MPPSNRNQPPCPVDAVLPEALRILAGGSNLVLTAPPGAGKSSRVPLALRNASWLNGRNILLLEPRRVAARALARYMARLLGEAPGQTIGLRMRGESITSEHTRIEVITEGVLLRMLQEDPALERTACVIFDEFHERSLDTDTGLALCLESRAALRPDLRLVVMSATLDAAAVARLMHDCPMLVCEGRQYPVHIRHLPLPPAQRLSSHGDEALIRHAAHVILQFLRTEEGSLLVFLPGTPEIRRLGSLLEGQLPPNTLFCPLYGRLSGRAQDAAVAAPPPGFRKITAATAIAETSLTIEGVRLVVDVGLSRSARFDPSTGMSRLVTSRVSLAGADQRAGRAGRTEPGLCCRLWAAEEEHGMRQQVRPEILDADLSGLALHLAVWGTTNADELLWLDPPPAAHLEAARRDLRILALLDAHNRPTPLGQRAAKLPLAPRTARMLLWGQEHDCGPLACCVAALLEEGDAAQRLGNTHIVTSTGAKPGTNVSAHQALATCDISLCLDKLCRASDDSGPLSGMRRQAERLARLIQCKGNIFQATLREDKARAGLLLAAVRPENLALRQGDVTATAGRKSNNVRYLLRSGASALISSTDPASKWEFLVAAEVDGGPTNAKRTDTGNHGRIRLAALLLREQVEALFATHICTKDSISVREDGTLTARRLETLGALILRDTPLPRPQGPAAAAALCEHIRTHSLGLTLLPWTSDTHNFCARVALMRSLDGEIWPDLFDVRLLDDLQNWLAPYLEDCTSLPSLAPGRLHDALHALVPPQLHKILAQEAPTHWTTPAGQLRPIIYGGEGGPRLEAKLQEFFGCHDGPRIAGKRLAVTLHLLSPAGRPLQVTRDLAGFWRSSYAAVRAEMRGRYPRHPWPEDPTTAQATAMTTKKFQQSQCHTARKK